MEIPLKKIQWVLFREHPIVHHKKDQFGLFEIHSEGLEEARRPKDFDHLLYNKLLIEKVLGLESEMLSDFLDYQCALLNEPYSWLTALHVLLEFNKDIIIELNFASKLNKAFKLVNEKKAKYQKNQFFHFEDDNPYRFDLIKPHLDKLKTHHEKKAYLFRMKTDYLQNRYDYDGEEGVAFDKKIDLELAYLESIQKMSEKKDFVVEAKPEVLIWEAPLNILADIYYQCLNSKTETNRPFLNSTKRAVEKFIVTHFRKPDGSEFNATTIRTILTPSRNEKRPNASKRIKVKKTL